MALTSVSSVASVKKEGVLGSILLISGCCIGAGTIGLPVLSAVAGFLPSIMVMFFSYLFTTGMGLLLLEATLWFDEKVNLLSIAQFALGRVGKWATGFFFLFLFYSLFVAYVDGGGQTDFRMPFLDLWHFRLAYLGLHLVDNLRRRNRLHGNSLRRLL